MTIDLGATTDIDRIILDVYPVLKYKRTSRQRRIKMALRNSTAYTSVTFGFIMLALTLGCIAAGAVAMSKLNDAVSSIGLWAVYVSQKIF